MGSSRLDDACTLARVAPEYREPGADTSAVAEHSVELLRGLHRHNDLLSIAVDGRWGWNGFAAGGHALAQEIRDRVTAGDEAVFFSVNGYGAGTRERTGETIRHVNSLFCDMDYEVTTTPEAHAVMIDQEIDRCLMLLSLREMPEPSVVVSSGTGFWIHYWLCADDSDLSIVPTPEVRMRWRRAAKALVALLKTGGFPADGGTSTDINRLTRVPGSINEKIGARVEWRATTSPPPLYTLGQMESHLCAFMPEHATANQGQPQPSTKWGGGLLTYPVCGALLAPTAKKAQGRLGKEKLAAQRRGDIRTLVTLRRIHALGVMRGPNRWERDGVEKGSRHNFAVVLAVTQRAVYSPFVAGLADGERVFGEKGSELFELVYRFGKNVCYPPMSDRDIEKALKRAGTMVPRRLQAITDEKIGEWLEITEAEQRQLFGAYLPGVRPRQLKSPPRMSRREYWLRARRAEAIRLHDEGLSVRAIAKRLWTTPTSVHRDLATAPKNPLYENYLGVYLIKENTASCIAEHSSRRARESGLRDAGDGGTHTIEVTTLIR